MTGRDVAKVLEASHQRHLEVQILPLLALFVCLQLSRATKYFFHHNWQYHVQRLVTMHQNAHVTMMLVGKVCLAMLHVFWIPTCVAGSK